MLVSAAALWLLGAQSAGAGAAPPLRVDVPVSEADSTDTLQVHIRLGTAASPVTDLHGVGYQMLFDPAVFEVLSIDQDSVWSDSTVIAFEHIDNGSGVAAHALSLVSASGYDGFGPVALIQARVLSGVSPGLYAFTLGDVEALDSSGGIVDLDTVADTVLVGPTTGVPDGGYASVGRILATPNPALGGRSRISFDAPEGTRAEVSLFDLTGRRVRAFRTRGRGAAGTEVFWNGRDTEERPVPAGVYFIRVRTRDRILASRIVVLR